MPKDWPIEGPPEAGEDAAAPPLGRRLVWMAGLMLAGQAATAALAYGLRSLLFL